MKYTAVTVFILLALLPPLYAEVRYCDLIYPLRLTMVQESGTVELWVRPDTDLTSTDLDRFYHFFAWKIAIGEKAWGEKGGFSLIWRVPQGLYTFGGRSDTDARMRNLPTAWRKKIEWPKGSWHHIAFSWQGKRMTLYADGDVVSQTTASERIPYDETGFWVVGFGVSPIAVDGFCVSSIARDQASIRERMTRAVARDVYTLILDPMETLEKTNRRLRSPNPANCRLVDGRFGKAIQLYRITDTGPAVHPE